MNVIKKLSVALAVLALVGFAKADVLYWQVDTSADNAAYTGDFSYAVLNASDGSAIDAAAAEDNKVIPTLKDLGGYGSSEYSFYVELYNAAGDSVYKGQSVSYTDLLDSGYISTSGVLTPTMLATGGFNGASVPEPTSGMLLLIGGALLALRRRRQA